MLISNLINNNYVAAVDDEGNEVIVKGVGIGYKVGRGSYIPDDRIEKIYMINNENTIQKLKGLLQNIPEEHFWVCGDIIDFAQKKLQTDLNPNLYVTLTDHVNYAIFRLSKGIDIANPMINEIRIFYPEEFEIGKYAVSLIEKKLGIHFGEDEAGFIAFHIVNAEAGRVMNKTMKITGLIRAAIEIIRQSLNIEMEYDDISFRRLVTHLQFIASDVMNRTHNVSKPDVFNHTISASFPEEMECSQKIADYIREHYDYELDNDEIAYLTVNISRVRRRKDEQT
ncbi:PRD domain-containing protein [Lachnospiraceae bacterium 54-53]